MADYYLNEYGIPPNHPLLYQTKLLKHYETLVNLCNRSTNADPSVKQRWEKFQHYFQIKPITEVINRSQSGKIVLFICPDNILSLISNTEEKSIFPEEILSFILSKLFLLSEIDFIVYQGKVEESNIILTPALSTTAEAEDTLITSKIMFPRHLLLDYSLNVLAISEKDFEYYATFSTIPRSCSFACVDTLPNPLLPSDSKLWKMCNLLTSSQFAVDLSEAALQEQEKCIDLLYDDSWASYFSALIRMNGNSVYLKTFLKVARNLLKLPGLRARNLIEKLVEVLTSHDFLFHILSGYVLVEDPNYESHELVIDCLETVSRTSQLSEPYAIYLIEKKVTTVIVEIIQKTLKCSFYGDASISRIIQSLKRMISNSRSRQKEFLEAGIIDCLDRCLLRFGSLILKDVILCAQALELKPNKYINLPSWLQAPFKDGDQTFESLVDDLLNSPDVNSKILGNCLQRSIQFGISSLIPNRVESNRVKKAVCITNEDVFATETWLNAKDGNRNEIMLKWNFSNEFISSHRDLLDTDQQLRLFAETIDESSWLKSWYLHLSENTAANKNPNRFNIDQIVPCYQMNTGLAVKVSNDRWKFSYETVDYFGLSEYFDDNGDDYDESRINQMRLCHNRYNFIKTSLRGLAWRSYDRSEWYLIRDDIYIESKHMKKSSLSNYSFKNHPFKFNSSLKARCVSPRKRLKFAEKAYPFKPSLYPRNTKPSLYPRKTSNNSLKLRVQLPSVYRKKVLPENASPPHRGLSIFINNDSPLRSNSEEQKNSIPVSILEQLKTLSSPTGSPLSSIESEADIETPQFRWNLSKEKRNNLTPENEPSLLRGCFSKVNTSVATQAAFNKSKKEYKKRHQGNVDSSNRIPGSRLDRRFDTERLRFQQSLHKTKKNKSPFGRLIWKSGTVWNSIDKSEWNVISNDNDPPIEKHLSPEQMQRLRKKIVQKLKQDEGENKKKITLYCINKWVDLMELNQDLMNSFHEGSTAVQAVLQTRINTLSTKLFRLHFCIRNRKFSEPNLECDDLSVHGSILSKESAPDRSEHVETVPVWWWFLSGNSCHLSNISRLPALTAKQLEKQKQLFTKFKKYHSTDALFVEFGSKWNKQNMFMDGNLTEMEIVHSKSWIDAEKCRTTFKDRATVFHQEQQRSNLKKMNHLLQNIFSIGNLYKQFSLKFLVVEQELCRLLSVRNMDGKNICYLTSVISPPQMGILFRTIERLQNLAPHLKSGMESYQKTLIEFLTLYTWLSIDPVSITKVEFDYSLDRFIRKQKRQDQFQIRRLQIQIFAKLRMLHGLTSMENFSFLRSETNAVIYDHIKLSLRLPTFPLKLFYVEYRGKNEMNFLQSYAITCQRKYRHLQEQIDREEITAHCVEYRSTLSAAALQIALDEVIMAVSFYRFIHLNGDFTDLGSLSRLQFDEIFPFLWQYVQRLQLGKRQLYKSQQFVVRTWYHKIYGDIRGKSVQLLHKTIFSEPRISLDPLPFKDEAIRVFGKPERLISVLSCCAKQLITSRPTLRSAAIPDKLEAAEILMKNLLDSACSKDVGVNIMTIAFYKAWNKHICRNISLPKEDINHKSSSRYHQCCTVPESGVFILFSISLVLLHFEDNRVNIPALFCFYSELTNACLNIGNETENDHHTLFLSSIGKFVRLYQTVMQESSVIKKDSGNRNMNWKDSIELLLKIVSQSVLMVIIDNYVSPSDQVILVNKEFSDCLTRVLTDTLSLELHMFVVSMIQFISERQVLILQQFLNGEDDGTEFAKILSRSLTISRISWKDTQNQKLRNTVYYLNMKSCRLVHNISQIVPKRALNKLLNVGLINDIAAAVELFGCSCPTVINRNLIPSIDTQQSAKVMNKPKRYLRPVEVSLNPPINGYKVIIQKVSDAPSVKTNPSIISSPSKPNPVESLNSTIFPEDHNKTEFLANNSIKVPQLNKLPSVEPTLPSKYQAETAVSVKNGIFRMPEDEDGSFLVKILSNAEPPIILSEHTVTVADGSVETKNKILDTKASGVETAFWDNDVPLSAATVTGNFIAQGTKAAHKLVYNTSANGSCIIPLPAGMIVDVKASKQGKVIIAKKDPVQVPPPAILQKPNEVRECIQNELSTKATTMAGCLRHLKARGVQRLIVLGDKSGSMSGQRFTCLKNSLRDVLEFCRKEKKLFNLGLWENNTEWLRAEKWINLLENPNDYENVQNWIENAHSGGGTELKQALEQTIQKFPDVSDIWTITDGEGIWPGGEGWSSFCKADRFRKVTFHFTALGGEADALELEIMRNCSSNGKGYFSVVNGNNDAINIDQSIPSPANVIITPTVLPTANNDILNVIDGKLLDLALDQIQVELDENENITSTEEEEAAAEEEENIAQPWCDEDGNEEDDLDEEKVRKWLKKHQNLLTLSFATKPITVTEPIAPSNIPAFVAPPPLPTGKKTHCFLSHSWAEGNHERVMKINQALKRRGYITWFDEEKMNDSIRQVMAEGLSTTACIVIFITRLYETKINAGNQEDHCFFEFDFASMKVSGLANARIAAATEKEMINPECWQIGRLAAEMGNYFVLDMAAKNEDKEEEGILLLEKQVDELAVRINQKIASSSSSATKINQKENG